MQIFVIALGGAFGAVLRYWMSGFIQSRQNMDSVTMHFPLGVLVVNVIGSLLIGLLFVVIDQRFDNNEVVRGLLLTGLLGGFTTFSTFSLETVLLLQYGLWAKALLNIIGSLILCIAAAYVGLMLGRWITT